MAGYDAMGMGILILVMTGIIGITVLNFILVEIGRNSVGNYWLWLLAFFLLPIISHALFIILLLRYHRKARAWRVIKKLIFESRRTGYIGQSFQTDGVASTAVTPFEMPEDSEFSGEKSSTGSGNSMSEIPNYLRDKKLEELIDWCEWGQSRIHVAEKMNWALENDNKVMIRVYEAYRDEIRSHSDFSN